MKTAIVCGASSGLGLYIARALCGAGYRVYAGARSFAQTEAEAGGMQKLPLDVSSEESAQAFIDAVCAREKEIDILINCAGILNLGSCEETSLEEYSKVININTLGSIRMAKKVLPIMRAQGHGRILQLSSVNGVLGIPFQSAYTLSKHALEGFYECLRLEAKPFGIEVTLIEPGDHRGGSDKYRGHAAAIGDGSPYSEHYRSATEQIAHDEHNGSSPEKLGKAVVRLLKRKRLPLRKVIAKPDQRLAVILHRILPGVLFQNLFIDTYYRKRMVGKAKK
ncbi:MAG: SDR family oxidoreductase [Eubacteriales bacterium]|nr:SDR family oxidoreductase [Eubacteriales bacterium]MDD3882994.1 SDR family oxidoreductase [Eubacteriales bacterium]MDD4513458.1 SDR family oxidoreductase [Eubacteriales bacterium]